MFYILLLEKDIPKKKQINKFAEVSEFESSNNKEYRRIPIRAILFGCMEELS